MRAPSLSECCKKQCNARLGTCPPSAGVIQFGIPESVALLRALSNRAHFSGVKLILGSMFSEGLSAGCTALADLCAAFGGGTKPPGKGQAIPSDELALAEPGACCPSSRAKAFSMYWRTWSGKSSLPLTTWRKIRHASASSPFGGSLNITVTVNGASGALECWLRVISNSIGELVVPDPPDLEYTMMFAGM